MFLKVKDTRAVGQSSVNTLGSRLTDVAPNMLAEKHGPIQIQGNPFRQRKYRLRVYPHGNKGISIEFI